MRCYARRDRHHDHFHWQHQEHPLSQHHYPHHQQHHVSWPFSSSLYPQVGVYDAEPEEIVQKGRLMPGKVLLVDTQLGKVIHHFWSRFTIWSLEFTRNATKSLAIFNILTLFFFLANNNDYNDYVVFAIVVSGLPKHCTIFNFRPPPPSVLRPLSHALHINFSW